MLLLGGGSHLNIAMPFSMEKLEWLGYPLVKKFGRCLFVLTECTKVMDRHCMKVKAVLDASILRKNCPT